NGILKNIITDQKRSAPLPYFSDNDGDWRNPATWDKNLNNEQRRWWDVPNGIGINDKYIDWNIVETSHDINAGDNVYLLGLLSKSNEIKILGDVNAENGQSLTISDYLLLDGNINLEGNSQLVQTEGSILEKDSEGYIDIDQQGTANSFNYNYWSSPVSLTGEATNSGFKLGEILLDATDPANPKSINFNYSIHWADGAVSDPKRISTYWLYTFGEAETDFNGDANDYFQWRQFSESDLIPAGIGYTMKGTTGYVAVSDRQNYTFRGKPNNGDIEVLVLKDQNLLTGNPYPSAINAQDFISDNIDNFNGSLYFWDHFGPVNSHYLEEYIGGYAVYNLSGGIASASSIDSRIDTDTDLVGDKRPGMYIPVGQAFFINTKGISSPTSIIFKNKHRAFVTESTDDSQFHSQEDLKPKKGQEDSDYKMDSRYKIRLKFESPKGYHRQILVTADPRTTDQFDLGYDAFLIENNVEDMYWLIDDERFVIQGVPNFNLDKVLPIGFKVDKPGEYTIKIDKLENISSDFQIYLKDLDTDSYHEISEKPYTSTIEEVGTFNDRYQLVFRKPQLDNPEMEENIPELENTSLRLQYSKDTDQISLFNPEQLNIDLVELYSITGQKIKTFSEVPSEELIALSIDQKLSSAVYIVRLYSGDKFYSKKVIISK
ncbi:MAG TPA: T9SS type A sorting domain-containing protein, partial [Christiangramia sp.]|nr:T9SS type A sorting domain-containing protein [Christiangramia sp.]